MAQEQVQGYFHFKIHPSSLLIIEVLNLISVIRKGDFESGSLRISGTINPLSDMGQKAALILNVNFARI